MEITTWKIPGMYAEIIAGYSWSWTCSYCQRKFGSFIPARSTNTPLHILERLLNSLEFMTHNKHS